MMTRCPFRKLVLILPLCIFLIKACTSTIDPSLETQGREYFPVEIGQFIEYEVEERVYTTLNPVQVFNYQIREEITESFLDIENEPAYKLERFRREQSNEAWALDSVWVIKRTAGQALRTENNRTFIKLIFPPNEKTTWNGNALNSLGEEEYRIVNLGEASTIGDMTFPNTLRVVQNNLCSLVELDLRNEEFAENVGLIYKEDWRLSLKLSGSCIDSLEVYCEEKVKELRPPIPLESCIEFGRIYTQKIIAYGKN
ncbi:MAG: hypothetical protein NW226_00110 [Microscillaceae bacterium]|nr:hypothetical protein [Microscillaceae bacterium]